jgi:hypothetical protein
MVKSVKDCRQLAYCPTASFNRCRPQLPLPDRAARQSPERSRKIETVVGRYISRETPQKPNCSSATASSHPQTGENALLLDEQTLLLLPHPTNQLADSCPTTSFSRWRPELPLRAEAARQRMETVVGRAVLRDHETTCEPPFG